MSRILIAERDPLYRQSLETVLASHGHQVRSAADGREALAAGVVFAPQVVLTGWLLGDHYHGLHVTEALRLVHPGVRGLLATRFGSPDVGRVAVHLGIFEVLPKPVELGSLLQVISNATADRGSEPRLPPLAVLVTDSDGRLVHRHPAGRRLAADGPAPLLLRTLLPGDLELADLCREWRLLERPDRGSLLARARRLEVIDSGPTGVARREPRYVVVLLPDEGAGDDLDPAVAIPFSNTFHDADFLIRALLDLGPSSPRLAVTPARALVVDPLGDRRRRAGRRLERGGLVCHLAAEEIRARSILRQDPGVGLVLLHGDLPAAELEGLVEWLEDTLPGVTVVGMGTSPEDPFPAPGIERVLPLGWSLEELRAVVEGRG